MLALEVAGVRAVNEVLPSAKLWSNNYSLVQGQTFQLSTRGLLLSYPPPQRREYLKPMSVLFGQFILMVIRFWQLP